MTRFVKTALMTLALGGVLLGGGAGAFRWKSQHYLDQLVLHPSGLCQLTYQGKQPAGGLFGAGLVLQGVHVACAPTTHGGSTPRAMEYAASHVLLEAVPWHPLQVHMRLDGPQSIAVPYEHDGVEDSRLLVLEGSPVEVFWPARAMPAGKAAFTAPFVHVRGAGVSMTNVQGEWLWNTQATFQASVLGLSLSVEQMTVPAWPQHLQNVKAAFSMSGPYERLRVLEQEEESGQAIWPELLVQKASAEWSGLKLGVTGHVRGGHATAVTGDFWLTIKDWKPFVERLHPEKILPPEQAAALKATLEDMIARGDRSGGKLVLSLSARNGYVYMGAVPLAQILPVVRLVQPAQTILVSP
ncbi:DUF2125 domain-containing protein [Acetobacter sp. LMG 32666]|uniref:DUF2125 domain-containing protein n=1 Tax=Acetobacter sp. LMG 32666 TaxID=2959295 RepID=UPI0030C873B9